MLKGDVILLFQYLGFFGGEGGGRGCKKKETTNNLV